MGIEKALLVVLDGTSGYFIPYLTLGLAPSTGVSVKIERKTLSECFADGNVKVLDQLPPAIALDMSIADSAVENHVLLASITQGELLIAAFCVFDSPYSELPLATLEMIYEPIRDLIRQYVNSSMEAAGLPDKHFSIYLEDMHEENIELLREYETAIIPYIVLDELIGLVCTEFPFIGYEACRKHILQTIHHTFSDIPVLSVLHMGHIYFLSKSFSDLPILITNDLLSIQLSKVFWGSEVFRETIRGFWRQLKWQNFFSDVLGRIAV